MANKNPLWLCVYVSIPYLTQTKFNGLTQHSTLKCVKKSSDDNQDIVFNQEALQTQKKLLGAKHE